MVDEIVMLVGVISVIVWVGVRVCVIVYRCNSMGR
jgi:hypothetical protein